MLILFFRLSSICKPIMMSIKKTVTGEAGSWPDGTATTTTESGGDQPQLEETSVMSVCDLCDERDVVIDY